MTTWSPEVRVKVWLLYLKCMRGDRGKLSRNILREVCYFLPDLHLLAHVSPTHIRFFDFQTRTWSESRLFSRVHINDNSFWVLLPDRRVFCCGGYCSTSKQAYIITREGAVEQKADMNEARSWHGLLAKTAVYAFGGWEQNTCEKFQRNHWTRLPNMSKTRVHFNPCEFRGFIYLGGSNTLDVFCPQTESFLLPIPLPPQSPSCSDCLYVDYDLLVVQQYACTVKFAAGQGGQLEKRSQVSSPALDKSQNSQPVVDKVSGLFYMVWKGECVCLNMNARESHCSVA